MKVVSLAKYIPYPRVAHAGGQYVLAHDQVLSEFATVEHFAPDTPINRDALMKCAVRATLMRGVGPGGDGRFKAIWDAESALAGSAVPWPWRRLFDTDRAPWEELAAADVIEMHWSEIIALAPRLRARLPQARLVGVAHDVITQRWERAAVDAGNPLLRLGYRLAARLSRAREARSFAALDTLIVFSEKDQALAHEIAPGTRIEVVHPGLGPSEGVERTASPEEPVVLFTGALGRGDNSRGIAWFLERMWPMVIEAVPEARLVIAGANPPAPLQALVARTPSVVLTGFVDSLEPYYASASVFVAPLRTGAGVKFKTVDAMLRGVPVITTEVGAEGIDARELFAAVTDDEQAFATAVVAELRHPDAARTARAAEWAGRTYGQASFAARVREVYEELLEPTATSAIVPLDQRRIVAVISVFGAPAALPARVDALLAQVDDVVLVDDGSDTLLPLGIASDRVHTVALAENSGIAAALNVAVSSARALGASHIVTLDQDSELEQGHVERLVAMLDQAAARGERVAGAAPGVVGGAAVLRLSDGEPFDPIQSGQVLPMTTFDALGGFDERLFIDAVDSDYTVRSRIAGMRFLMADDLHMAHELGELVPITVFGRRLVVAGKPRNVLYHSPMRTYYMVRNSAWLRRTYGARDARWMRLRNRKLSEMVIGGALLAPDRRAQVRAVIAGLRDARRGTLGRIPDDLKRRLR